MTSRLRNTPRDRGQAMVEFVMVVPLLLLLLLGIFQFGVLFNNYVEITNASRDAVRKGAVSRTSATGVDDVIAAARASASTLKKSDIQVVVSPLPPWTVGQDLTVTVKYPGRISILGVAVWSGMLSAETTVRVE